MDSWPGRSAVLVLLLLLLAALVAGLAIHAMRVLLAADVPVDREVAARGHSRILGARRQGFAWCIGPVEERVVASGVSPDALTTIGCVLCGIGALQVAAGDLTVGGLVVLGSSAFDFLDGRVARRRGSANPAGEFLDSTLDRYADAFCFGGAAFFLRDQPLDLAAALVALGAAAIVPYARAKAEALGQQLKGGLMQRPERVVLFSAAAIFASTLDALWPAAMRASHPTFGWMIRFLALATSATAISRTREGRRRLRDSPPKG